MSETPQPTGFPLDEAVKLLSDKASAADVRETEWRERANNMTLCGWTNDRETQLAEENGREAVLLRSLAAALPALYATYNDVVVAQKKAEA